jgi:hypothetical protein
VVGDVIDESGSTLGFFPGEVRFRCHGPLR